MADGVYVQLEDALLPLFASGGPLDTGWGADEVVDTILDAIRSVVDQALIDEAVTVPVDDLGPDNLYAELIERFVRKATPSGRTITGPEWDPRFGSTKSTERVIDAVLEAIAVRLEARIRQRMIQLEH